LQSAGGINSRTFSETSLRTPPQAVMTSTVVRVRTSSGVKRVVLEGSMSSLTVSDLKTKIVLDNIFSERGDDFGLKMEGKRKNIVLDDYAVTLEFLGVVEGTMFTIDFLGGIRAETSKAKGPAKEDGDLFHIEEENPKKKRTRTANVLRDPLQKKKVIPTAAVVGHFDVESSQNIEELVSYFVDNDVGPEGSKEIGCFLFNQFTTAARVHALMSGKVTVDRGTGRSDGSSSSGYDRNQDRISVSFRSEAGKPYEETCNFLSVETISEIMCRVLERLSTKRRKNTASVRKMFSVASLASRAPWILWPIVSIHGPNYQDCQDAIDSLLDAAFGD
jgi:hypothetical protein